MPAPTLKAFDIPLLVAGEAGFVVDWVEVVAFDNGMRVVEAGCEDEDEDEEEEEGMG